MIPIPTAAVDVLIPVYNGAATIESALCSIQAQSLRDIRMILIDDGSTDESAQIIERMAEQDGRIVLLRQANSGIVDALNAGLALCTAPLIARHDADDLAAPDRFEKQIAYLEAHPDCSAVSGAVIQIDEAGKAISGIVHLPSPDRSDADRYPQIEPYLIHPFLMIRHSALQKMGGYRHVFHAEDTDLYWRLQEVGNLHNMHDFLGNYRIHTGSVTGSSLLNGRISAVNSQRSGISALRRRAGRPDIDFPKDFLAEYKRAGSLEKIVEIGARDLDAAEAERLAVSSAAKLLELAGYRPYEIEDEDCRFINRTLSQALKHLDLDPSNRKLCIRMVAGTSARLIHKRRIAAGLHLTPFFLYPHVISRVAIRALLPTYLRKLAQRMLGRGKGFIK
ncbi:MAG: glycosyltransferase family 2 protein [Janthinobacterium lividum]